VAFEDLPNKIKKRIEKRKAKREALRLQRKVKLDLGKSEESLVDKYKQAYGGQVSDEKLKEYIYYQKLIHDAKLRGKNKIKRVETVTVEEEAD